MLVYSRAWGYCRVGSIAEFRDDLCITLYYTEMPGKPLARMNAHTCKNPNQGFRPNKFT